MRTHLLTLSLTLWAVAAAEAKPAKLKDVRLAGEQVVLKLSRPAGFSSRLDGSTLVVTLDDAELSGAAKRVSAVGGVVRSLTAAEAVEGGVSRARVTIVLDTARLYALAWHGSVLTVELQAVAAKPAPAAAEPPPAAAAPAAPTAAAKPAKKTAPSRKAEKAAGARKPGYAVQLGSYVEKEDAVNFKAEIEPKVGELEIKRARVPGGTVYRILLGPFPDRAAAEAAMNKAAAQGVKGLVIRD